MKNSLNFASTCLNVVDTRRKREKRQKHRIHPSEVHGGYTGNQQVDLYCFVTTWFLGPV
jgi:hypothetical protein